MRNKLLSITRNVIPYVKELRSLKEVKSASAAILMQQLEFWFEKYPNGFYKFTEPCSHEDYNPEDSWCEELAFSKSEFVTAFNAIGCKYKSKSAYLSNSDDKFQGKYYLAYTDRKEGKTYYFRNHDRVDEALDVLIKGDFSRKEQHSSGESENLSFCKATTCNSANQKSSFLESQNADFDLYTETTSEINSETNAETTHSEREQFSENKKESRNGASDRAKYQNQTGASGNENPKSQTSSISCLDNNKSDQANYSEISLEKEKPKTDPYFGKPSPVEYQRQKAKDSAIAQSPFGSVEEADHFYAALKKYVKVTARKELTEGSITGIAKSTYNRLLSNQADPEDRELLQRWQSGELSAFLDERVTRQSYQVAKTTHDLMSINPTKEVKI